MVYRFEGFELDPQRRELRENGAAIDVEPQVFDLLLYLIDNAEHVVSKDELFEHVWSGRLVSDSTLSSRINAARRALGDDGDQQRLIRTVPRRGFRFVGEVAERAEEQPTAPHVERADASQAIADQKVRFCTSRDGAQIAFATTGSGYPLVRAGHWLTHLEHDWHSPIWRPFLDELGRTFAVTRYDQRGCGLSDWSPKEFSLRAFVDDLEAVVDAAGLERFALYGTSQGAGIAITYATLHPDRVSHLILHGGYVQGRLMRDAAEEREDGEALITLMGHGWGKEGSAFLNAFTATFIPDGTKEQSDSMVDLQRQTTSAKNAVKLRTAVDSFDVSDLLAKVITPTVVTHARNDGVHPLDQGRKLAAGIKNAEFVLLESANHIILPEEPAWERLNNTIRRFVLG